MTGRDFRDAIGSRGLLKKSPRITRAPTKNATNKKIPLQRREAMQGVLFIGFGLP